MDASNTQMARVSLSDRIVEMYQRKQMLAFGIPVVILAYLVYVFFAFNIPGLADRARLDNAATLVADAYSYKTHVTRDNRSGEVTFAIEGENKGTYPEGSIPEWVQPIGPDILQVTLYDGYQVELEGDAARMIVPDFGVVEIIRRNGTIMLDLPEGDVPPWINASSSRVTVTVPAGRLTVTRNRTEVFRYQNGWELFFFTLDSPFYGKSLGQLTALVFSSEQLVPGRSNLSAMALDFWHNKMWRHADVAWAMFETVLMAFLGTMGAAIVGLPLAFLAASNFTVKTVRFALRRVFDFLRGVDGLIWTILLARAFGPGPLTGSLAILLTDTGTFGKLFSEALENVDNKQIEGVRSTGASALQRYRFGVIPQITPVLISQVLYYLESNTRSATIIGAIVGGGIGLLLTQAIVTQKDWEEVSYYVVLIVLMVMLMDMISGWLRARLIGGTTRH